jgi:hypothetical protein
MAGVHSDGRPGSHFLADSQYPAIAKVLDAGAAALGRLARTVEKTLLDSSTGFLIPLRRVATRRHDSFSGEEGARSPVRWHHCHVRVIYMAGSKALGVFECRANLTPGSAHVSAILLARLARSPDEGRGRRSRNAAQA